MKNTERVYLDHGFGSFFDKESRYLILGSFPSVKSREVNFYYGHPQNRFWKILAAVFQDELPKDRKEKEAFLSRNHIALYDVIESCSIIGSADSTIEDVQVTDLGEILEKSQVGERIFTNGAKANKLYMKYTYPKLGIQAKKLPSSSPANAAYSLEKLISIWKEEIGN